MSVNCPNGILPVYVKQVYDYEQNIVIDSNLKNKIRENNNNDNLDIAANVALYWESEDKSFIAYRLLKYKDDNLVVCDQIEGFEGRSLKGFLKYLWKARMIQYRIVSEECGSQYVLMETKK